MQRLARLSRLRPTTHFESARYAASLNPSPGAIRVQKVQFFKPRRSMFRPLRITLWFCAFYMAGSFAIDALLEDDDDDEEYESAAHEPEETQRVTFIPLPFTEQKVIPPPYERGSPEWLAFKKISDDPKRMNKLKRDLTLIAWTIITSPSHVGTVFASTYGRPSGVHPRLSVQFPHRPPPEWSQKGLVFNDGEISLAVRQPADSRMIHMVQRALRPLPLAQALWRYTKTITEQTYDSIVGSSNSPDGGASPHGLIITAESSDGRRTQVTLPIKPQVEPPPSSSAAPNGGGPIQASHQDATPSPGGPSKTSDTPDLRSRIFGGVPASGFGGIFPPTAWNQLVKDVRTIVNVHPAHRIPPRGVVHVSGQIYVETTKNYVTLQVAGWWDPKTEKYQMPLMELTMKEMTPKVSQFN